MTQHLLRVDKESLFGENEVTCCGLSANGGKIDQPPLKGTVVFSVYVFGYEASFEICTKCLEKSEGRVLS